MALSLSTMIFIIIFISVFIYFYKTNHVVKYVTKIFYFHANFFLVGIFAFPVAIMRPMDPAGIRPFQYWWQFSLRILGMKFITRNTQEFEKLDKPAILVMNHQSNLDMSSLFTVSPYRSTFLTKKAVFWVWPFGLSGWLVGLIYIDRLNPDRARKTMTDTARIIKDKQVRVWVFPEGTRNMDGNLLPFKKGAFHLAVEAQVPIYPLVVSSYRHFMDPKKKIFNSGKVIISALPPIQTTGLTKSDVSDLTEKVESQMAAEFQKITREVQADARANNDTLIAD